MPYSVLLLAQLSATVLCVGADDGPIAKTLMPSPLPAVPLLLLMLLSTRLCSFAGEPAQGGVEFGLAQVGIKVIPLNPLPVTALLSTRLWLAAGPSMRMPLSW